MYTTCLHLDVIYELDLLEQVVVDVIACVTI